MPYSIKQTLLITSLLFMLQACGNLRFDTQQVDLSITPDMAASNFSQYRNSRLLWGGTILGTRNFENYTQIEMLAYPLDRSQRPQLDKKTLGRFLIHQDGYLEPENYSPGRELTVLGTLREIEKGMVGKSSYLYPLIKSTQHHLWRVEDRKTSGSFHFGIGIGL